MHARGKSPSMGWAAALCVALFLALTCTPGKMRCMLGLRGCAEPQSPPMTIAGSSAELQSCSSAALDSRCSRRLRSSLAAPAAVLVQLVLAQLTSAGCRICT